MNVLIVEGDKTLADTLDLLFRAADFTTYVSDEISEALDLLSLYQFDVVVLEAVLPTWQGADMLRRMRDNRISVPVIVLTDADTVEMKVAAFAAGADDVLVKPVHKDELICRAKVAVRRANGAPAALIQIGPLSVNLDSGELFAGDTPVKLTGKERAIISNLAMRRGKTVTKEALMHDLYGGMDEPEIKIIDVFVCKLRSKIRDVFPGAEVHIETIWGRGYRLTETPPAPRQRAIVPNLDASLLTVLAGSGKGMSIFDMSQSLTDRPSVIRPAVRRLYERSLIRLVSHTPIRTYALTDAGRNHRREGAA